MLALKSCRGTFFGRAPDRALLDVVHGSKVPDVVDTRGLHVHPLRLPQVVLLGVPDDAAARRREKLCVDVERHLAESVENRPAGGAEGPDH